MNFHAGQRVGLQVGGKNQNGTLQALNGWEASLLLDGAVEPIRVSVHDLFPQFSNDNSMAPSGEPPALDDFEMLNQQRRYELRHNIERSVRIQYTIRAALTVKLRVGYRILKNVGLVVDDFNRADLGDTWEAVRGDTAPFTLSSNRLNVAGTDDKSIIAYKYPSVIFWPTHGLSFTYISGTNVCLGAEFEGGNLLLTIGATNWKLEYLTEGGILSTLADEAHGMTMATNDTLMILDDDGVLRLYQNNVLRDSIAISTPGRTKSTWGFANLGNAFVVDSYMLVGKAQEVGESLRVKYNTRKPAFPPTELSSAALDAIKRRDTNYQG